EVQAVAASLMASLSEDTALHETRGSQEGVKLLVKSLRAASSASLRPRGGKIPTRHVAYTEQIAQALGNLARDKSNVAVISENGGAQLLLDISTNERSSPGEVLQSMRLLHRINTESDCQAQLRQMNAVPLLISFIRASAQVCAARDAAADLLLQLAETPEGQMEVRQHNGIELIIHMLHSHAHKAEEVVNILARMARQHVEDSDTADNIFNLVSPRGVQRDDHQANEAWINVAGGIPLIINMLHSESQQVVDFASALLSKLAGINLANQKAIIQEATIPLLLNLANDAKYSETTREHATEILLQMSKISENHTAIKEARGIVNLVKFQTMGIGSPKAKGQVAATLGFLANRGEGF
ncbi:hypothetical protein CYMTET_15239, partial [Cymbomonas tetramitiformis]